MRIVFATNNKHKLDEVRRILGKECKVLSLADIECFDDIPETGRTLEENALMKAKYVYERYQCNVFADDTGLEVEALDGEPGTFSARYASIKDPNAKSHDSEANMTTLLKELEGKDNRKARFRTVIALVMKDLSLTASWKARLSASVGEGRASATTLSSNPQVTTRPSPNLATTSKTLSATAHVP